MLGWFDHIFCPSFCVCRVGTKLHNRVVMGLFLEYSCVKSKVKLMMLLVIEGMGEWAYGVRGHVGSTLWVDNSMNGIIIVLVEHA